MTPHNILIGTKRVHRVPVLQKNIGPQLTDEDKKAINLGLLKDDQITDFFEDYNLDAMNEMISEILASEHFPGTLIEPEGNVTIFMPTYFDDANGPVKSHVSVCITLFPYCSHCK